LVTGLGFEPGIPRLRDDEPDEVTTNWARISKEL